VGEFFLDIRAIDGDGNLVVIENQLERTDHSHLGQCLVYASGLAQGPVTVVWVAPRFRDDYRRALDWLNESTVPGIRFFGVEVGVVQISGEGPRAPVFDVVARPNDWQKTVASERPSGGSVISQMTARRQDFFTEVMTAVNAENPSIRVPARNNAPWLAFASGPFGYWGLAYGSDGQLRVEAYLDCEDKERNKRLFDLMQAEAGRWQAAVSAPLSWERRDDKRYSRIGAYHPWDIDDDTSNAAAKAWAVSTLAQMYGVMNAELRSRAKALRTDRQAAQDVAAALAHDQEDQSLG
jgi:Domain of unknown function (DUF4268)